MQEKNQTELGLNVQNNERDVLKSESVKATAAIAIEYSKHSFEQQISTIFDDITCSVRFASSGAYKISHTDEAYFEILKHWDKRELYFDKGFRILVCSKQNEFELEISLKSGRKTVQRIKFAETLKSIYAIQPACKVIVSQNNPKMPVVPTDKETNFARYLKKVADKIRINLVDQLIVSGTECFSFEDNKYMQEVVPVTINRTI